MQNNNPTKSRGNFAQMLNTVTSVIILASLAGFVLMCLPLVKNFLGFVVTSLYNNW